VVYSSRWSRCYNWLIEAVSSLVCSECGQTTDCCSAASLRTTANPLIHFHPRPLPRSCSPKRTTTACFVPSISLYSKLKWFLEVNLPLVEWLVTPFDEIVCYLVRVTAAVLGFWGYYTFTFKLRFTLRFIGFCYKPSSCCCYCYNRKLVLILFFFCAVLVPRLPPLDKFKNS
jgi:hypothetical protein